MKTLTIGDLARSERLDRPTMSAVRGGWKVHAPGLALGEVTHAGSEDASIAAVQHLGQSQEVLSATANGAAFAGGVQVDIGVAQRGAHTVIRR